MMWKLAQLAHQYHQEHPAGYTEEERDEVKPVPAPKPAIPFQVTPAHLQALDFVDDGYRMFRMMNR